MEHRARSGRSAPVVAAAIVLGLMVSGALVWQASSAAFTSTTGNAGNNWTAGSVALTNNLGSAMFDPATNGTLVPGSTGSNCIDVTFTGNVASTVRLYSSNPSGDLGQYLDMKIEEGPTTKTCSDAAGWTAVYNDDLEAFHVAANDWATGEGTWAPSATGARRFKFTYTLQDTNDAMGDAASVTYTWEARSNAP